MNTFDQYFAEITDRTGKIVAYATHDIIEYLKVQDLPLDTKRIPVRIPRQGCTLTKVKKTTLDNEIEGETCSIPCYYTEDFEPEISYEEEAFGGYDHTEDLAAIAAHVPRKQVYVDEDIYQNMIRHGEPLSEQAIPELFILPLKGEQIHFREVRRYEVAQEERDDATFYVSYGRNESEPTPMDLEGVQWYQITALETLHFEDLPDKPTANVLGWVGTRIDTAVLDAMKWHGEPEYCEEGEMALWADSIRAYQQGRITDPEADLAIILEEISDKVHLRAP